MNAWWMENAQPGCLVELNRWRQSCVTVVLIKLSEVGVAKVMIRYRNQTGDGWQTNWLNAETFKKRFIRKLGETARCPVCGFMPTECYENYYECPMCTHIFFEP